MKLLKFYANWCNSCKAQDKELAKLKNIPIEYLDVDNDEADAIAMHYSVKSLPTMLIVDNNIEKHRFVGFNMANDIQDVWNKLNEE